MTPNDIEQIIDKYGRPVYEAALRQVYINSALQVAWAVVLVAVAFALWRLARTSWARGKEVGKQQYGDDTGWQLGAFGAYTGSVVSAIAALALVTDASGAVLNPTWKALEIILGAVGK